MASMKTIVNQVIIAGELIDFVNVKSGVSKNGNEYFKFNMVIETNKETSEQHQVEFFEMKNNFDGKENPRFKSMITAYEEYKSRVTDGEGEIVRVTGKLTMNPYVSKNENKIINKIVVKGNSMHRDRGDEKEREKGLFDFCSIFKGMIFVDKLEEIDAENMKVKALVNEYKSKKGAVGHLIDIDVIGKEYVDGVKALLKENTIASIGLKIADVVDTVFLDEDKTVELEKREMIGFGDGLREIQEYNDWVEKENERRKDLRENGLKIHRDALVITGCSRIFTEEDIEKEDLPFDRDSINDMFDLVEDKMADLEAQLTYDNINDEDVPF